MKASRVLALAVLTASSQVWAVSTLSLDFNGTSTSVPDTGFDAAYNPDPNPNPYPNPGFAQTGFNVGVIPGAAYSSLNGLTIFTLPNTDIFGRYETQTDPDDAHNVFYSNFDVGSRTTITSHVIVQRLNNNYHGGGIWLGTDEDRYIRLGVIFNGGLAGNDKGAVEMLRENEDLWPPQTNGSGHAGGGNDIAGQQVVIPNTPVNPNTNAIDPVDITLQLIRTGHTARAQFSLDGGATWTPVNSAVPYFGGIDTSQADGETTEGGYKVGLYGFGGGSSSPSAIVSFDNYNANTVTLANVKWQTDGDGTSSTNGNWSGLETGANQGNEGRVYELPTVGTGRHTITLDQELSADSVVFNSPNGYTLAGTQRLTITGGTLASNAGNNEISAPVNMTGFGQVPGRISVAAGSSLKLSGAANMKVLSADISPNGKLDLTTNTLLVDYLTPADDPYAQLRGLVAAAYDKGKWDGNGILSSTAANPALGTALAVVDNAELHYDRLTHFAGYFIDDTTVILRYTWYGDANLDGKVDAADLAQRGTTGTGWYHFDFNYDGVSNEDDYALFLLGAALQNSVLNPAVPEPTVASSLACLGAMALVRRRRER